MTETENLAIKAVHYTEEIETPPDDELPGTSKRTKRISRRALLLRRFLRNRMAVFGLILFGFLVLVALFGPLIAQWGYAEIERGEYLKAPSGDHWFGTTQAGRDIFAMTIHGLRKSLIIGLTVAIVSTTVAAVVGSFAAYFGGAFERIALWVIDLLLVLPSFLIIAILMTQRGGNSGGVVLLIVLLAAFNWMLSARVVRSLTQSIKDRDYVLAAKYMGVSGPRIVFRHILPNISSLLIVDATLNVAGAVLAETGLSFFGFGIQSPDTSLGTLIAEGQKQATTFPWTFLAPSVFLVLMVTAVNFIGDGLRDAFDPSSKSGGRA
jgi:peptide/nickel transport system permease protein